jgi:hypothetical protein
MGSCHGSEAPPRPLIVTEPRGQVRVIVAVLGALSLKVVPVHMCGRRMRLQAASTLDVGNAARSEPERAPATTRGANATNGDIDTSEDAVRRDFLDRAGAIGRQWDAAEEWVALGPYASEESAPNSLPGIFDNLTGHFHYRVDEHMRVHLARAALVSAVRAQTRPTARFEGDDDALWPGDAVLVPWSDGRILTAVVISDTTGAPIRDWSPLTLKAWFRAMGLPGEGLQDRDGAAFVAASASGIDGGWLSLSPMQQSVLARNIHWALQPAAQYPNHKLACAIAGAPPVTG